MIDKFNIFEMVLIVFLILFNSQHRGSESGSVEGGAGSGREREFELFI